MDSRRKTQIEIWIQVHIPDDPDTKTGRIARNLGIPGFTVCCHTGISQYQILRMQTYMKSQMKPFQIRIGLVLHLFFLRHYGSYRQKEHTYNK